MVEKKEKESKSMPFPDGSMKQDGNGTMDYTSKQEKFESEDKSALNRGAFKKGKRY